MQPDITIYTKGYCPHCKATKALLTSKGVTFLNHDLETHPSRRKEMIARAGGAQLCLRYSSGLFM